MYFIDETQHMPAISHVPQNRKTDPSFDDDDDPLSSSFIYFFFKKKKTLLTCSIDDIKCGFEEQNKSSHYKFIGLTKGQ